MTAKGPDEEAYLASKDEPSGPNYTFLLHAIGRWVYLDSAPGNAPVWALLECRALYEESERRVRSPSVRGPREGVLDGALLEFVADLFVDGEKRRLHGVTPRRNGTFSDEQVFAAAVRALGAARRDGYVSRSQTRKISNAWTADKERRLERARMRWLAEFGEKHGIDFKPSKPRP